MPRSRLRLPVRAAFLALVVVAPLAFAGLAPSASAQVPLVPSTLTVTILDPGGIGLPVGGDSAVLVTVTYNAGPGRQPGVDPATGQYQPTRVSFEVTKAPSWVNATRFEPPVANLSLPLSGNAAGNATLILTVDAAAPGRQREDLVVVARAEPNGNIQGASAESSPLKLRPRVVTKVNVTSAAEGPLFLSGGRWQTIPFVVRNDGNFEVTTILNVTLRPEDSQVELSHETLTLPRGGSETVEVRLRTPWTYATVGTVELEALPLSDDEEPPAARASVEIAARSATPMPAPGSVLAAFLLAGVLLRRRGGA